MAGESRRAFRGATCLIAYRAVVTIALGAVVAAGCSSDSGSEAGNTPLPEKQPSADAPKADSAGQPVDGEPTPGKPEVTPTARGVLEAMVAVYQGATRYADTGSARFRADFIVPPSPEAEPGATPEIQKYDETFDLGVALERPNKIRMTAYQVGVVCDGQKFWATVGNLPGQVLQRPAPGEMTIRSLLADYMITDNLGKGPTQGYCWLPVQLALLLADDPLKTLLFQGDAPELLDPAKIEEHFCHRVRVRRPDGTVVFWIDRKSSVLRRLELPTDAWQSQRIRNGQEVRNLSLVADFHRAEIDGTIPDEAFQFDVPPETEVSESFEIPVRKLLGQGVPAFEFTAPDGKAVTAESLKNRIVVLDFWSAGFPECAQSLVHLDKARRQYKENARVEFLAVNVDSAELSSANLAKMLDQLGVEMPVVRDPKEQVRNQFHIAELPAVVLIGPSGTVEYYFQEYGPAMVDLLSTKLETLLGGGHLHGELLETFPAERKEYEKWLADWTAKELFFDSSLVAAGAEPAQVAAKSEPQRLKLTSLWKCAELAEAGNVLVVDSDDGPPRLLVIDGGQSVVELGPEGNVAARHDLKLPEGKSAVLLRTAAAADGRRYFLALTGDQEQQRLQQLQLYDAQFGHLLTHPENVEENPHPGIADARIADLDGDGTLDLCIGYYGIAGVHCVSLQGRRRWRCASLEHVMRLAVDAPGESGVRSVFCANMSGAVAVLDGATGDRSKDIDVGTRPIQWIAAADVTGGGRMQLAGLFPLEAGVFAAIGFTRGGEELWTYPLPRGTHRHPIEPLTAGPLLGGKSGQWILAGADGSIHLLDSAGRLVDRFNHGATLTGLAAAELDGRGALLVATPQGVEALRIDLPGRETP